MGTTATLALPYPELTDSADIPRDMKALADALDAQSLAPPGVIQMWPGNTAPTGWFLCRGQSVPAAANPKLAALFGSVGTNVVLPDLQGRLPLGAGTYPRPAPTPALVYGVRDTGGEPKVKLTAAQSGVPVHGHNNDLGTKPAGKHSHGTVTGYTDVGHGHSVGGGALIYNASGVGVNTQWTQAGSLQNKQRGAMNADGVSLNHRHSISEQADHDHVMEGGVKDNVAANAASEHENLPPYYAINFIIRAG